MAKKSTTPKRPTAQKPAAKKSTPAQKPTAKKLTAKKPTAKKPTAKKPTAKKLTAKKPTAKKPTVKKPSTKKTTAPNPTPAKPKAARKTPDQLAADAKAKSPPRSRAAEIIGHISWLMMLSSAHKHLFIGDLEWLVAPAVTLKQFRLYQTDKTPWAYASWAFLTEEAEERLVKGQRRLQPAEWKAGNRPWLIDVICPFGGAEGVLKDISENVFPKMEVKALVPSDDGKGMRVMVLKGKDMTTKK